MTGAPTVDALVQFCPANPIPSYCREVQMMEWEFQYETMDAAQRAQYDAYFRVRRSIGYAPVYGRGIWATQSALTETGGHRA